MREFAVKIHKVEASWSDQRKIQYIRHTVREFEIHKALRHRRIAQLLDTFEIDTNTFATVMELCDGGDLDQVNNFINCTSFFFSTVLLRYYKSLVRMAKLFHSSTCIPAAFAHVWPPAREGGQTDNGSGSGR